MNRAVKSCLSIFFLVTASLTFCSVRSTALENKPASWLALLISQKTSGLDCRPSKTTCIAPDRSTAETGIALTYPFPDLERFSSPTKLLQAPGDDSKWYVLEKQGHVRLFNNVRAATTHALWLNISDNVHTASEGGLLGMAFDPDWPHRYLRFISLIPATPAGG